MASNVLWYPAPRPGELVEFTLYFVREGGVFAPSAIHTVLSTMPVSETDVLYLVASQRPGSQPFLDTVERLLRENVCRMEDVNKFIQGSFLWVTQSVSFLTGMTHPEGSFSHGMTQGAERNSHGMTHP